MYWHTRWVCGVFLFLVGCQADPQAVGQPTDVTGDASTTSSGVAAGGASKEWRAAFGEGDYERALNLLMPLAIEGDPEAQNAVGEFYMEGWGVDQDYREAMSWLRKSAEQGDAIAYFNLGKMYENGWGVTKDCLEAIRWYQEPAKRGDPVAQVNLGGLYSSGSRCVAQDDQKAMTWFRRAADQGDPLGQTSLGAIYATGAGVKQDYAVAMTWYRKAAAQGYANAQHNLGHMYEHGEGVPPDNAAAMEWYAKAAEQGHPSALARLKALAELANSPSKVPSLHEAISASTADLAKAYDTTRILLEFYLPVAEQGVRVHAQGQVIDQENVEEVRSVLQKRQAVYEMAIMKSGYKDIANKYDAKATSSCGRTGSQWAGGIWDGAMRSGEIFQDGFNLKLIHDFEFGGQTSALETAGVIVESVVTFRDPINTDFVFLGTVGSNAIEIRPDVDAVLASWPDWAKPPARSDLSTCTVALSPASR